MEIRCETKHSMHRRCRDWDYRSRAIYSLTWSLADRRSNALGSLVIDDPGGGDPAEVKAHIELTPAGRAVKAEWHRIDRHWPEIKPIAIQIMPDHIHAVLFVQRPMPKPLGIAIGGFKAGSSKAAIGRPGFWAAGFQDTILFREGQLAKMLSYLDDNPRRLAVKRLAPDLFRVTRDLRVGLRGASGDGGSLKLPLQGQYTARFCAIGNHFLLDAPQILQVQCSRSHFAYRTKSLPGGGRKILRDAAGVPLVDFQRQEFIERRDHLLDAARHGVVLLSPCISHGEREIARLAFAEKLPVITMSNKGFSPLYKPGGKLFDQTAEGRLLMLAPINWPYIPGEKRMTRDDACALNRLAQLIAGPGAAEINYRGMRPGNIERLAAEAADIVCCDATPCGLRG